MTLPVFDHLQAARAKQLLATCVARMMGRKFEEGDWTSVYCAAKSIPLQSWSNLHIDVVHNGLGVEQKMLCRSLPLRQWCGTTQMHPALTRSIRVNPIEDPNDAMTDIFTQYQKLVSARTEKVASNSFDHRADMRTGWLLWEPSLTEFLYFEEPMITPRPRDYWAEWHVTNARGIRKSSRNLWIFEKRTNKKRFSITTVAGAKIQPYFDVPGPNDPNLVFMRVQGEPVGDHVLIWVTRSTLRELKHVIGDFDMQSLSEQIEMASEFAQRSEGQLTNSQELAQPVEITANAYAVLLTKWGGVSDEHRLQLFLNTVREL